MAVLPEDDSFPEGVYRIEATDPVLGGPPNEGTGAGLVNIPAMHLAKRTRWLKTRIDALLGQVVAATTDEAGIVQLSTATNSPATDRAATPSAVKAANDNANARALASRNITAGGLVTGGGNLSADRVITVPVATQAEAEAGTSDTKAMTPLRVSQAIAAALAATWAGAITIVGNLTATRLRLTSGFDASGASTQHAFQIGADTGPNLAMDQNEIVARDNGGYATLNLQIEGGNIALGNPNGVVDIPGKLSWAYESAGQAIVANSVMIFTHGLGVRPAEVEVLAKCITTQSPYAAGEEVRLGGYVTGGQSYGIMASVNASTIHVRVSDAARLLLLQNTGSYITMTLSSWQIIVRARK